MNWYSRRHCQTWKSFRKRRLDDPWENIFKI